ncbi:flagellar assembly protein T N-terminal domain-containing protein [uncultured Psychromonas sp.]|uniref:flagellar assembly protein T N-terminal domain-containing protein n=1 Tax=uncultured Psychromonas sp. TaxID=173974 RepID=UPI002610CFA7|nr:flagellar assembly protein T N-terminal domain-containing protein [uncultured Psychromonas sp.]
MYKKLIAMTTVMAMSFSANAQWYSSEGTAEIIENDINKSRDKAISNALLTVIRSAGTSAESVQVVKSGVLQVDKLSIRSNGEIHDMRVTDEVISGGYIKVTVQADIYPFSTCPQEKYSKSLFVGPFNLATRSDAQLGAIYHADEAITQHLFNQLKRDSNKIDPRQLMTQPIAFANDTNNDIELQTLQVSRDIANKYNVQYLLFGTVKDMSDFYETTSNLLTKSTQHKRNFQMDIYLVDAINKITLLKKKYVAVTDWPYSLTHQFDTNSNTFWSTDYGQVIEQNLNNVVSDVRQALYCQPTMATIIAQFNDQLVMNIGHRNGVKKGDQFQLIRSQSVLHQSSLLQGPIFVPADIILTVVSVQSDRAILETDDPMDMSNIQIRDMLTPVDEYTLIRLGKKSNSSVK